MATADCGLIARASDSCDYAVKDGTSKGSAPEVPHSEWFCTELAELVGIAAPGHKILKMPDGTLVFGSRWEGEVYNWADVKDRRNFIDLTYRTLPSPGNLIV